MQHLPKYHSLIFFFITLLVILCTATPALADYLGPDRTVTQTVGVCKVVLYKCEYVEAKGVWKYKSVNNWSCSNESKPWQDYSKNSSDCNPGNDGHKYWEREEGVEQIITTNPPATISGSIQNCSLRNGWCVTAPDLALNANEPLAGYSILLVEGTRNAERFACPVEETTCNVPLTEGENKFTYWALSSWGDSSKMGTSAARVDTVAPSVGLDISGVSGKNGWYISPTTVTATGSDATSGVASTLLDINDGAPQVSATLNEGVYKVDVEVTDKAGNISSSSTTVSVDTTTPVINGSLNGTIGRNGWFKSVVQISAVSSDATSGIGTFEVSVDGAAYQAYTPITFKDGHHTIRFRAVDNAGNQTETEVQKFNIDTTAPIVDLPGAWQLGTNVPYTVRDNGSGLAALRIVIEDEDEQYAKVAWNEEVSGASYSQDIDWNGQFKDKTVAPPGTYLVWIKASDRAGNERFQLGKVIVPEPNVLLDLPPTEEPSAIIVLPNPPAELSETEPEPVVTDAPVLGAGGATTEPGEVTTQSVLLATGTAGAVSTSSSSGILWGVAATFVAGLITAIVVGVNQRRKEAEAAQAAKVISELNEDAERRFHHKKKQLQNQADQQAGLRQGDVDIQDMNAFDEVSLPDTLADIYQGYIELQGTNMLNEISLQDTVESTNPFEAVSGTAGAGASQSEGSAPAGTPSIWQNALNWFQQTSIYTNVIDPYVVQPLTTVAAPVLNQVTTWAQNTWNTYVQPNLTLQKVTTTFLIGTLGITGIKWANNIVNNPQVFDPTKSYVNTLIQEFYNEHPSDPAYHTLSYLWNNPYDALSEGADVIDILTKAAASYADTIWQQNPVMQTQLQALVNLENEVCGGISNQNWANRCTAAFYLPFGWEAMPFDTALGVADGFLVDPITGIVKQWALATENLRMLPDLIGAFWEGGFQGAWDFEKELINNTWDIIVNDSQVQSAYFFELLIELAILLPPVASGIVLTTTTKGLIDLDKVIKSIPDKGSLIDFVTSPEVRTAVASSLLILAMITTGLGKKVLDFRTIQKNLSPAAQWDFQNLSLLEQTRIADAATQLKLSPSALEFYLKYVKDPASSLAKVPLTKALSLSSFVDTYGEKTVSWVLRFCDRYGMDPLDILAKPLAPGQSVFGLVLGIDDPANPVNHPLVNLNLTDADIAKIVSASVVRPDSKVVVLGYGGNCETPYYVLGENLKVSYISISEEMWAPFNNARGNFWTDINAPFIESAIDQRKIFLFNVEYKVLIDPKNAGRFSLAELRLIELEQNNYVEISIGKYTAFVPAELIDTYKQYLPASLFGSGE